MSKRRSPRIQKLNQIDMKVVNKVDKEKVHHVDEDEIDDIELSLTSRIDKNVAKSRKMESGITSPKLSPSDNEVDSYNRKRSHNIEDNYESETNYDNIFEADAVDSNKSQAHNYRHEVNYWKLKKKIIKLNKQEEEAMANVKHYFHDVIDQHELLIE